jgi:hypothetical protein
MFKKHKVRKALPLILPCAFYRKARKGFLFARFYKNAKFAKLYQYSFANFAFNMRNPGQKIFECFAVKFILNFYSSTGFCIDPKFVFRK